MIIRWTRCNCTEHFIHFEWFKRNRISLIFIYLWYCYDYHHHHHHHLLSMLNLHVTLCASTAYYIMRHCPDEMYTALYTTLLTMIGCSLFWRMKIKPTPWVREHVNNIDSHVDGYPPVNAPPHGWWSSRASYASLSSSLLCFWLCTCGSSWSGVREIAVLHARAPMLTRATSDTSAQTTRCGDKFTRSSSCFLSEIADSYSTQTWEVTTQPTKLW